MEGLLIVGHGSLRPNSATGMERVATCLRERSPNFAIETGFLNYGRPSFAESALALAECGVRRIFVQPYFLTFGQYVQQDLPKQIRDLQETSPVLQFRLGPVLGEHSSVTGLLSSQIETWRKSNTQGEFAGIVLVAHGSHFAQSVCQVQTITARLQDACLPIPVVASYLEINQPDLETGCRRLLQQGTDNLAVLPYFLHSGRHVKEDLPRILASVSKGFPDRAFTLLDPLDDTRGISEIILNHMSDPRAVAVPK